MDAGGVAIVGAVAGIVGAVVGGAGTLGAAALTGRRQAKTQHDQWRRQVRRDAYATYLAVVLDYQAGIEDILGSWASGTVDLQAEEERLKGLRRDVRRAASVVSLEGPEELADSLRQAAMHLGLYSTFTVSETPRVLALPTSAEREERARVRRRSDASLGSGNAIAAFETAARKILDS